MSRWLIVSSGITGVAFLALLSWFIWPAPAPSAARVVPADAIAVYKGTHLRRTYKQFLQSRTAKAFQPVSAFQRFNACFKTVDAFLSQDSALLTPSGQTPMYASLHRTSLQALGLLFAWQTKITDPLPALRQRLIDRYPGLSFQNRDFRGFTIWDAYVQDTVAFSVSAVEGIVVASPAGLLVEDGLRHFQRADQPALNRALKQEADHAELFLNFQAVPRLLGVFANHQTQSVLPETTALPGFGRYKLDLQKEGIDLSGPVHLVDTPARYPLNPAIPARPNHFAPIAPIQTAFLHAFALPDQPAHLYPNLMQPDTNQRFAAEVDSLEEWYGFQLREDFLPLTGNQVAIGVNEPVNPSFQKHTYAVLHYADTAKGFQKLADFANRKAAYPRVASTVQEMTYRGHKLQQLAIGRAFPLLFGPLFQHLVNPFYTTLHDGVVLAEQPAMLKRIIDAHEAGQTLAHAPSYTKLQDQLFPSSQHFTYLHPGRARQLPLSFMRPAVKDRYKQGYEYYAQFSSLSFQLKADTTGLFSQVSLLERTNPGPFAKQVWQQQLEAPLAQRPEVVVHPGTQDRQLLLTDQQQHLYYMDNEGAIQWKRSFRTQKMGPADTVDLYQTGTQQYLFATRGKLHLLDPEGQEIGGFPLTLSALAATEAKAYTLGENTRPHYFIGCQNDHLYGYQTNGSPLPGWSPVTLDAPLAFPVKYYQYRGRLRLFGVTESGTFYLWNKKGELQERHAFNTAFTRNFSMHFGATDSTTYLVSTDTAGRAHFLYLNGDTTAQRFGNFSGDHHFLLADLNGDGAESLIFAENRTMTGYLPDGVQQFTLTLQDTIAFGPEVYRLQGRPYLGYGSAERNRIFLIDQDGKPYQGFPLEGNTPFRIADMNRDGLRELIVGGKGNQVIMYQIQ